MVYNVPSKDLYKFFFVSRQLECATGLFIYFFFFNNNNKKMLRKRLSSLLEKIIDSIELIMDNKSYVRNDF